MCFKMLTGFSFSLTQGENTYLDYMSEHAEPLPLFSIENIGKFLQNEDTP